jgi:hypothetical protein
MATRISPYAAMPKDNGRTYLALALMLKKPDLYTNGAAKHWKQFWDIALQQMSVMYRNGETWLYPHHSESIRTGEARMSALKEEEMLQEFTKLKEVHGFQEEDCSDLNDAKFVVYIQHPKLKKSLIQCDLTFKRLLGKPVKGKDGEEKEPLGYVLCPIHWGLGARSYGFTYIRVTFSTVKKTKEMVSVSLDIANRKFMA